MADNKQTEDAPNSAPTTPKQNDTDQGNMLMGGLFSKARWRNLLHRKTEAAPTRSTTSWEDDSHQVELSLEDILKDDNGSHAIKLQVVSLADFREALGPMKWLKIATKVQMIGEGVAHKHMGQQDILHIQGGDTFVMIFKKVSPQEGRRRALLIADELGERLVGDQFAGLDGAHIRVADLDPEEIINESGTLDVSAMIDTMKTAEIVHTAGTDAHNASGLPPISTDKKTTHKDAANGVNWQNLQSDGHKKNPQLVQTENTPQTPSDPTDRMSVNDHPGLKDAADPKYVDLHYGGLAKKPAPEWQVMTKDDIYGSKNTNGENLSVAIHDACIRYGLNWCRTTQSLDTILCQAGYVQKDPATGKQKLAPFPIQNITDINQKIQLSRLQIHNLCQVVDESRVIGRHAMFVWPVSADVLLADTPNIAKVLSFCPAAQNALILEVTDIERTPPADIAQIHQAIAPLTAGIMYRLSLKKMDYTPIMNLAPMGVSLSLRGVPLAALTPEKLAALFTMLAKQTGNTPLALWNAITKQEIAAAMQHNFQWIGGPILVRESQQYPKERPLPLAKMEAIVGSGTP